MIRNTTLKVSLITISLIIIFIYSCNSKLNVLDYPIIELAPKNNQPKIPVQFSIITAGTATTQEAFVFRGGSLFKQKKLSHIAVWVKHPKGNFLFDTGLGDNIGVQYEEMSFVHKLLFSYKKGKSVKEQLMSNGLASIP